MFREALGKSDARNSYSDNPNQLGAQSQVQIGRSHENSPCQASILSHIFLLEASSEVSSFLPQGFTLCPPYYCSLS
jgi:hypothetical protein